VEAERIPEEAVEALARSWLKARGGGVALELDVRQQAPYFRAALNHPNAEPFLDALRSHFYQEFSEAVKEAAKPLFDAISPPDGSMPDALRCHEEAARFHAVLDTLTPEGGEG